MFISVSPSFLFNLTVVAFIGGALVGAYVAGQFTKGKK